MTLVLVRGKRGVGRESKKKKNEKAKVQNKLFSNFCRNIEVYILAEWDFQACLKTRMQNFWVKYEIERGNIYVCMFFLWLVISRHLIMVL